MINLNKLFKTARELQDIKQTALAVSIGLESSSAISKYEKGKNTLAQDTLVKLAPLLRLNPDYILEKSPNPFSSNDLIKMYLPEDLVRIDFEPLYWLVDANQHLEIVLLLPARRLRWMDKIDSGTTLESHAYCIIAKDQDSNIFLFRRRSPRSFILADRDFRATVDERAEKYGTELTVRTRRLPMDLYNRIQDWTVARSDIEPLFRLRPCEPGPGTLTDAQQRLLQALDERNIDPLTVLDNLDRLQ